MVIHLDYVNCLESNTSYCFESEAHYRVVTSLFPEVRDQCLCFETLLDQVAGQSLAEADFDFQSLLLPEQLPKASLYERTLLALREALVLSHEDVEFCFSLLTPSPRTHQLAQLFHRYLDSPLALDRAAITWSAIERLRSFEVTSPLSERVVFVSGGNASYLFSEFANAFPFALGNDSTERVSLETLWPNQTGDSSPEWVLGNSLNLITDLNRRVLRKLEDGCQPSDLFIPIQSKNALQRYLQYLFDHQGIEYTSLLESPQETTTTDHKRTLIDRVRRCREIPLKERLSLSHKILEDVSESAYGQKQLNSHLEFLVSQNYLSPKEKKILGDLTQPQAPETSSEASVPEPRKGLCFLPLLTIPMTPSQTAFPFADESFLEPPQTPLLLDSQEQALLHRQGFPLPNTDAKEGRFAQMRALGKNAGQFHLAETPQSELPDFEWKVRWAPPIRPPKNKPETGKTKVSLPRRPLSATQLETYARCPAQYFFQNRLRLQPPKQRWESRYALLLGIATHEALELAFQDKNRTREQLEAIFRQAVIRLEPALAPNHPLHFILRQHFSRFADKVPQVESLLAECFGPLRTEAIEKAFTIDIAGLSVRGKIDRIDRDREGRLLVLDYKTGAVTFSPNHIGARKHFQGLLYLMAVAQVYPNKQLGMLFYDLKKGEIRRGLICKDEIDSKQVSQFTRGHAMPQERLDALIETGTVALQEIAEKIGESDFHPLPNPSHCLTCDLGSLCRQKVGWV